MLSFSKTFYQLLDWGLTSGESIRIVEVQFRDCALNESAIVSDSIVVVSSQITIFLPFVTKP